MNLYFSETLKNIFFACRTSSAVRTEHLSQYAVIRIEQYWKDIKRRKKNTFIIEKETQLIYFEEFMVIDFLYALFERQTCIGVVEELY